MDDAEYKSLWALIDKAHIRIGYLESEKSILIKALSELLSGIVKDTLPVDIKIAIDRSKQLLETMKGE